MADHNLEIPEIIQTASIRTNPSAAHDINPQTAASEKQPVVAVPASEAGSLASDIVDESRVIRPVRRSQTLPPLPDLRFEQSYLASLKDADSRGRVAWITMRDQVRGALALTSYQTRSARHAKEARKADISLLIPTGPPSPHPRHSLDTRAFWVALLESQRLAQWADTRKQDPQVVVRGQQLEAAPHMDQGSETSTAR